MWWHSAITSERGFWIITEKTIGDIVRLQLSEVFDWLVKKNWRHSEFTSERGFLKKNEKIEDILRLQLCEVYHWLVKKNVWRHSEATNKQKFCLDSGKNYVKTFCDYIWARFLNNYWKNNWRQDEATTKRGYIYARFMVG